ncbi:MAG: hypothetical protein IKD83_02620 [Firmicutes bacterium]|nr:hypothetical protein [Bacillota bacterium]MBQ7241161.1 hypothetical protein [Bacillota bacterium]MBR0105316.1 hypothetical protein [Bacillota bacterium]MBR2593498.1 hypothetical protein [Bacillota bacterium]
MNQTDLEKKVSDMEVSFAKNRESTKSLHKRVDKLERTMDSINELALSVRDIAGEVRAMRSDLNDLNGRVRHMEMKPEKMWNNAVETVISVCIGAVAGYVFSVLF